MKRTQSKAVKPATKGAVKVRVMYGYQGHAQLYLIPHEQHGYRSAYYILPADPESYDAMVEQMAWAEWRAFGSGEPPATYFVSVRLALDAIGIRRNPRAARATTKGAE